jgi:carbamoyltransferase
MYILGLNSAYHETAACLIKDGQLIAMAEEERFNRVKHGKPARIDNPDQLPTGAIQYCLARAGISLGDIAYIGYSFNPSTRLKNINYQREPVVDGDWGSKAGEFLFYQKLLHIPAQLSALDSGQDFSERFVWIDHHLCHAGSAFFVSPFNKAAIAAIDGIGEFDTTWLGFGHETRMEGVKTVAYPNSLGFLWEKLSKFLGFEEYDAAKVMGLAAYGNPHHFYRAFRSFVEYCQTRKTGDFSIDLEVCRFRVEDHSQLERLFGTHNKREEDKTLTPAHADVAATLQMVTEEILLALTQYLHQQTHSQNLCLSGGVALNCVANTILQERSGFKNIYIQPAANDAGTAIGAAYYIWHQLLGQPRSYVMNSPYTGPDYSEPEIEQALQNNHLSYTPYGQEFFEVVAQLIADGRIVAWFQGQMEVGPRALGNRSLLADPRRPEMRDIINHKVKHREPFRPFAPSVLAEKAQEWFQMPGQSVSSDFMLFTYKAQPEKRQLIPAVLHIDGTGRIQTVNPDTNPGYHRLISEFEKLTGVPLVLNTSFNDSEPIVCSPEDAVATFLNTHIDYLALSAPTGNYLVARPANKEGS